MISIAAENDTDWWVIVHGHDLPLKIIEVEIHLPCVAVAEHENMDTEKERYEIKDVGYGSLAYVVKEDPLSGEGWSWEACAP